MASQNNVPTFIVNRETAKKMIENFPKGKIFSMFFERVAPKCIACNHADKKWKAMGLTHCPHCGQALSFERTTLAQRGIENPKNPADKPKGTGVSAKEAMVNNVVKYYDVNAGGYRSARMDKIKFVQMNGKKYIIL